MNSDPDLVRGGVGTPTLPHDKNEGGVNPMNVRKASETETDAQSVKSLSNYREAVESLIRLRSNSPITNSIPAHAAILFEKFFEHSKDHVRIFCSLLSPEVFGNPCVVEQAQRAVDKRDVRISVITQSEPMTSPFLDFLNSGKPGVRLVVAHATDVRDLPTNFAVMDSEAVRVEIDRGRCEATAVMNAPQIANAWAKYFDRILLTERSEKLTRAE